MADVSRIRKAIMWYNILKKKRRNVEMRDENHRRLLGPTFWALKRRRREFMQAVLACKIPLRTREIWMHPHSFAWFNMVELTFNDEQWYANFRVTRGTFVYLLHKIDDDITRHDTAMRQAVTAKRRLALTLYYLSSTSEYRTIGNLFGVSTSFVCSCIKDVCQAITKRLLSMISFPSGGNLVHVIQGYEKEWEFPMCAGAVDGTHIPIHAPHESHTDYVNRKGYHSIIMQAVVDYNYLFRDIVVGWPGSVHDARVFTNSSIFKKGNANELFPGYPNRDICGQNMSPVIIADPAYPLLPWLMKPYPVNNATPRIEKKFNYCLSRARMTVENTFGRWKGRFIRFSKRVDMEVSPLVTVVTASCILHNICEIQNNKFLSLWQVNNIGIEEPAEFEVCDDIIERDAVDIRAALAEYFN